MSAGIAGRARISARILAIVRRAGKSKPWQKREEGFERPARRDGERKFDRPKFDKPRYDKPRDQDRGATGIARATLEIAVATSVRAFRGPRENDSRGNRPKFSRPRFERKEESAGRRDDRRPRPEGRRDWQEHPRSERPGRIASRTARAATTRMTARSSRSVRPSAAAAPIASGSPISTGAPRARK